MAMLLLRDSSLSFLLSRIEEEELVNHTKSCGVTAGSYGGTCINPCRTQQKVGPSQDRWVTVPLDALLAISNPSSCRNQIIKSDKNLQRHEELPVFEWFFFYFSLCLSRPST
jgi:hypothetical protein